MDPIYLRDVRKYAEKGSELGVRYEDRTSFKVSSLQVA